MIARKRPLAAALPSVVVAVRHFLPAVVTAPTLMHVRATAKRFALTVAPSTIPGVTMTRASMAAAVVAVAVATVPARAPVAVAAATIVAATAAASAADVAWAIAAASARR